MSIVISRGLAALQSQMAEGLARLTADNAALFQPDSSSSYENPALLAAQRYTKEEPRKISPGIFLHDMHGALKKVAGSRFVAKTPENEDKAFLRAIVGGLSLFLGKMDAQSETEIAGMVDQVISQIADPAIQKLILGAGIALPTSSTTSVAVSAPLTVLPPVVAAPQPPAPTVAAPITTTLTPFDYHPNSEERLDAEFEYRLANVHQRIQDANISWPYDFVRWCRSLYLLAGELPNGDAARVRGNITRGLRRINELASISVEDIRRLLGPSAMAVGRYPEGISQDWPRDISNDFGSAIIAVHDVGETVIANKAALLWKASTGLENQDEIRGDLVSILRRFEIALLSGRETDHEEIEKALDEIALKIPEAKRPEMFLKKETVPQPSPIPLEPMSQAEWVQKSLDFLVYEKSKWGSMEGELSNQLEHLFKLLKVEEALAPRAPELLGLAFQLMLSYRQMVGVSGIEALALGKDPSLPISFEDRAKAFDMMKAAHNQLDLLQEWGDAYNKDPKAYQPLFGENGLAEIVSRYIVHARGGSQNPLEEASGNFVQAHPELKLSTAMARRLLSYFVGLTDGTFNEAFLQEVLGAKPKAQEAAGPELDLENTPFLDVDPNKYTPYGRVFGKVVLDGGVIRVGGGKNRPGIFFGIYLTTLEKIYRKYREQVRTSGSSSFESAYTLAVKQEKYQERYRKDYEKLFGDLLRLLGENKDMADLVETAILSGKTQLKVPEKQAIPTSGGPPMERPVEEAPTAALAPTPAPVSVPPSVEVSRPAATRVDEAVFAGAALVSPDAPPAEANPFIEAAAIVSEFVPPPAEVVVSSGVAVVEVPPPVETATIPAIEEEILIVDEVEVETFPAILAPYITKWSLGEVEKKVLQDMCAVTSPEAVLKALDNIEQNSWESEERKRKILTEYARALELGRITERGKKRVVELLASKENFGRVRLLLSVAAAKPTSLVLDQIIPDPIQLGKKGGRYLDIDFKSYPPVAVVRPAITLAEGLYEEIAVMPSGRSVLIRGPFKGDAIDIGIDHGQLQKGIGGLLGELARAQGAIESGARTSLLLLVFNENGMTPRARKYFFSQHPQGTLIEWYGNTFSRWSLEKYDDEIMLQETRFDREGNKISEKLNSIETFEGEVEVHFVTANDRNPHTERLIEKPTTRAIEDLRAMGESKEAIRLKVVRDAAINAVGFLNPNHPDADKVIEVAKKFGQSRLSKRQIVELKEELDAVVIEIEHRFDSTIPPKAVELAALVGVEKLTQLLTIKGISSENVDELIHHLLVLKTKFNGEVIVKIVDQLLEVSTKNLAHFTTLLNRLAQLERLVRQRGLNITDITLKPETLYGGWALTLDGKVILIGSTKGEPFHVPFPLGGTMKQAEGIAGALAPNFERVEDAILEGNVSGLLLMLVGEDGITEQGRDSLWTTFGSDAEVWVLKITNDQQADHYIFKKNKEGPLAESLGEEIYEVISFAREEEEIKIEKLERKESRQVVSPLLLAKRILGVVKPKPSPEGAPAKKRWEHIDADFAKIFADHEVTAQQIWGPLSEIVNDERVLKKGDAFIDLMEFADQLNGTFEAHLMPMSALATGIQIGEPVFPGIDLLKWRDLIETSTLGIQEALFDLSDTEEEGIAKIVKIPQHLHEFHLLLHQILMVELNGYRNLLNRLDSVKASSDIPPDLARQKELIETLRGRAADLGKYLGADFFKELNKIRTIMQNRINYFNEVLKPKIFEFQTRDDLELPSSNPITSDLYAFVDKYGFKRGREAEHGVLFVNPATGITVNLPYDDKGLDPRTMKNSRSDAIKAVEESLRKEGRMPPA
ncbi:MAG: hypothetical protein A3F82_04255 [Deltaproteobacteria bacterium RIFCSPLOWO2_12_FULL_44_12]|nr:MAG: hypothetical protein A2712_08205 [Deltaproteobacteria bacterium RIFCSPHIGHO2_01_FULL_43_49]OGQ14680.1 MAG: hypothetical protein A3D22_08795 [Deltaproteobacteria bacterium RIFCSPHIGHO2_02_FULL_44_53]OGQ28066.1 MAG: hypothetical protein A3D98_07505 [Deltaproteobacteria bacterium RIFCSPHIGHO2_12_FULL_44_21]OGQ31278.1 MAG: hypothetical protein A2979_07555 [Deltaproteobacteria bacterium RIFCSPLOWO2_01_FULL_45_74]OGQ43270.1 MAG: hypothetical protein A3I70_01215 [Deltaproteobacteria bacterium 